MWGDYNAESSASGAGGGGFLSQATAGPSSDTSKRNSQNIIPCALSHLLLSTPSEPGFSVNGIDIGTVVVMGIVRKIDIANTSVTYLLDDYSSPPVEIKQWIDTEDEDMEVVRTIHVKHYIRVYGAIRAFQGKRTVVAFKVEKLTDMNQLTLHLIEVMHAHLTLQKRLSNPGMFAQSGISDTTGTTAPGAISLGGGGGATGIDQGFTGQQKQVYDVISSFKGELGISFGEICSCVSGLNQNQVRKEVDFLSDEGHIYSTIDEDHFKSTNADD